MKKIFLIGLLLIEGLMLSCSSTTSRKPKSTNVDSTNLNGEAPVKYEANDPLDTTKQLPKEDDTGKRANTRGDWER